MTPDVGELEWSRRVGALPALARRFVERAVGKVASVPSGVRVTQEGRMRLRPAGRWLPFTATEDFEVGRVGFSWRARVRIGPMVWLIVTDEYARGAGRLEVRLWGRLRVMRASGPDVTSGQLLRYLGELFWTPYSVVANHELGWRDLGGQAAEVTATVGRAMVSVRVEFDDHGDLAGVWTSARPRQVGKTTVDTPWRGEAGDYATVGGIRVPRRAEVRWELPEGPFTYWQGRVTGVTVRPGS